MMIHQGHNIVMKSLKDTENLKDTETTNLLQFLTLCDRLPDHEIAIYISFRQYRDT